MGMTGYEFTMSQEDEGDREGFNSDDNRTDPAFSANAIYLARTAQINTLTLSQMADQKASILLGTTFVVFSIVVTKLIGSDLTWSIVCLSLTAFVSSLFAVFAVLPSHKGGATSEEGANVLFFGTFANMEEAEWQRRLMEDFKDDEAVLRIMMRDVHQNGQVLFRRKYRFLNYAYRVFLVGLAITLAAYLSEVIFGLAPITTAANP